MTKGPVSRCAQCGSVVNVHWSSCLVCRAVLDYRNSELSYKAGCRSPSTREEVIVEPAVRPDGTPVRPVYWESQGRIIGPGRPEFFFQDSTGQVGLILHYEGDLVSVAAFMLRSYKAFIEQRPLKEVELVREGHR